MLCLEQSSSNLDALLVMVERPVGSSRLSSKMITEHSIEGIIFGRGIYLFPPTLN